MTDILAGDVTARRVTCPVCDAPAARPGPGAYLACARCGLRYAAAVNRDGIERGYGRQVRSGAAAAVEGQRRPVYDAALALVSLPPRARCLDVGCGAGTFLGVLAGQGLEAVGVDPAAPALEAPGVRVVRAAFPCPEHFEDAGFDLVTFLNSLNYFEHPVDALREARRVLRPHGVLLVRTPNDAVHRVLGGLLRAVKRTGVAPGWLDRVTVAHPRMFTARALAVALARAGFVDIRVTGSAVSSGDPYRTGVPALRLAKRVIGASAVAVARLSGDRLLLSPSLVAIARKDAAAPAGNAA